MLYLLDPADPQAPFPPAGEAEEEPNGLLAIGGDLSPVRLLNAYRQGIFPWYSEGQPILWWSPDPRTVLFPERLRISRSLGKSLRNRPWRATFDQAFTRVMRECAAPRGGQEGTWITDEMLHAYSTLHGMGHAHSVEVWNGRELVGGLYGIAIGRIFFGESMFSSARDASKVALAHLVEHLLHWRFLLIDCQVYSEHLITLGAEEIGRNTFLNYLEKGCGQPGPAGPWGEAVG